MIKRQSSITKRMASNQNLVEHVIGVSRNEAQGIGNTFNKRKTTTQTSSFNYKSNLDEVSDEDGGSLSLNSSSMSEDAQDLDYMLDTPGS